MLVSAIFSLFYTFIFTVSINLSIKRKKKCRYYRERKKTKKKIIESIEKKDNILLKNRLSF